MPKKKKIIINKKKNQNDKTEQNVSKKATKLGNC